MDSSGLTTTAGSVALREREKFKDTENDNKIIEIKKALFA